MSFQWSLCSQCFGFVPSWHVDRQTRELEYLVLLFTALLGVFKYLQHVCVACWYDIPPLLLYLCDVLELVPDTTTTDK